MLVIVTWKEKSSVMAQINENTPLLFILYLIFYRGRLLHGRHFTYKSINGDTAITFVSTGVEGAFATEEHPYAAHGPWLQVYSHRPTHELKISI